MPTPDELHAETPEPIEREVLAAEVIGQAELDDGLAELDALSARPLHEHVEVYQRLHAGLQAALAEIDGA